LVEVGLGVTDRAFLLVLGVNDGRGATPVEPDEVWTDRDGVAIVEMGTVLRLAAPPCGRSASVRAEVTKSSKTRARSNRNPLLVVVPRACSGDVAAHTISASRTATW
jgi:hypothetical protein